MNGAPLSHTVDISSDTSVAQVIRDLLASSAALDSVTVVGGTIVVTAAAADADGVVNLGQLEWVRAVGTPAEVLTAENLSSVYGLPVSVVPHPAYGTPLVLPDGRAGQGA